MMKSRVLWTLAAVFLATANLAGQEGAAVNGYARTKAGALLEDASLFLSETTLDLRLSYRSGDAGFFANPVLYEREGQTEEPVLREAYMDFRGESFDLRLGKQQIIWGKGDGVFITDIVSPKDLSRFLVPDFEEIRGAVTGACLDLYLGSHALELVWLPAFTPGTAPAAGSLWAPALPFPVTPTFESVVSPGFSLDNGEYFARYSFLGESFDLALMGGWFWNDTPGYTVTDKTFVPGVGITALTVRPEYYRTAAAGYAASGAMGPVILKSEGAFYGLRRYQGNPMIYPDGYAEKYSLQYMAGADASAAGFTFGIQFIQDLILDHDPDLVDPELKTTMTFVATRTFLRDTLTAEVFTYMGLDPLNALVKPKVTWDATDALEFFLGAYLFLGDEGDFGRYDSNDGVYLGAKFSF